MIFDSFRARVGVVIINKGQILLIRDVRDPTPRFHLPGDIVKLSESLERACKRVVKEQTGLDIELQKLLYVRDDISNEKHRLDLFFLGKIAEEQEVIARDDRFKLDWVNLQIIESMDLFPKFLRRQILEDWEERFRVPAKYVGPLE